MSPSETFPLKPRINWLPEVVTELPLINRRTHQVAPESAQLVLPACWEALQLIVRFTGRVVVVVLVLVVDVVVVVVGRMVVVVVEGTVVVDVLG